jgi:hypothetical protein
VEFQWDGRRFAGLWIPDEDVFANIGDVQGEERKAKLAEYAQGVCEQYTEWCNGDIYGYEVTVFAIQNDEDGDPSTDHDDYDDAVEVATDSCWGYYGWDAVEAEASSSARNLLK